MKFMVVIALLYPGLGARMSLDLKSLHPANEIDQALEQSVSIWNHEDDGSAGEESKWVKAARSSSALLDTSSVAVQKGHLSSNQSFSSSSNAIPPNINPSSFTVIVAGSGHSAQVATAMLSMRYRVFAFSIRRAASWKREIAQAGTACPGGIQVHFGEEPRKVACGSPDDIVSDPKIAEVADVIFLAMPTNSYKEYLSSLSAYARPGTIFVALMSHGGTDLVFRQATREKASSFSYAVSSNLPWSCRGTGTQAIIKGVKNHIKVAVTPKEADKWALPILTSLLGAFPQVMEAPNQLTLSLGVAYLIHIGIMYGQWSPEAGKWNGGVLAEPPLFYHGVDDFTEHILISLSNELQNIKRNLMYHFPNVDLSGVLTMQEHYKFTYGGQMSDCSRLKNCFHTCKAYSVPVKSVHPMIKVSGGYLPDFQSRYLTEDVPMSVVFIKGVAALEGLKVATPVLDKALDWAQSVIKKEYVKQGELTGENIKETSAPQAMNINSVDELLLHSGLDATRRMTPRMAMSPRPGRTPVSRAVSLPALATRV